MGNLTERSARKELRAVVERALAKEAELSEGAKRRVVNRILRQSDRIAEIGEALCAAAAAAPVAISTVAATEPEPQDFDPYAIGAVVTLQRHGADALLDRLAGIKSVENLRSLAVAQNLALKTDWSNADQLRVAIVQSAEQRLAERRAAAS
jgi:3-oxoacyl-ACP reductase-like protein